MEAGLRHRAAHALSLAVLLPPRIRSAAVTYLPRSIVCAALLLLGASTAVASSVAPNVQVNVKQGRTTVFTAITDARGRFTTMPIEPGIYTFELRALRTAPPAQYFLLLAGAKPVSAAMADQKAVLMMDAQVRRPRSVTGQVTARRLRIVAPPSASPAPELGPAPARATTAVAAPATSTVAVPPARATTPARASTGARVAVPVRARSTAPTSQVSARPATASDVVTRSIPTQPTPTRPPVTRPPVARPVAPTASTPAAARSVPARPAAARPIAPAASAPTARPVNTRTRIINGKPHIWVPVAPGSTLGRWVPGQP